MGRLLDGAMKPAVVFYSEGFFFFFFRNVSKYKKMSGNNSEDTAGWLLFVSVAV